MKKFRVFIVGLVLGISVLFSGMSAPMVCHAVDSNQMQTRLLNLYSYSTDVTITDSGVANIYGIATCKTDVSNLSITVTLQMSVSGRWVNVKTWSASTSKDYLTVADTYQLTSRGTYRVVMDVTADSEEKQAISAYRTF